MPWHNRTGRTGRRWCTRKCAITSAARLGPPSVMIWTRVNRSSAAIPMNTSATWTLPQMSGRVRRQNIVQRVAPSIVAASYRLAGIVCIPAMNRTM